MPPPRSFFLFFLFLAARLNAQQPKLVLPIGHNEVIRVVAFSPDGKRIVTGSMDNTAKLWDAFTGLLLADLKAHDFPVMTVAFSPDGSKIMTGDADGWAIIWSATTSTILTRIKTGFHVVNFAEFSSDGKRVLISTANGSMESFEDLLWLNKTGISYLPSKSTISVWEVLSGKRVSLLKDVAFNLFSPHFSPDNTKIISPATDSTARIWDAGTGKQLFILRGHTDLVMDARYSPDGKKIVTASWDKSARIWDAGSGKQLVLLAGHKDVVNSAVFSHSGNSIVTASFDGTARVWDTGSGNQLASTLRDTVLFYYSFFSRDDKRFITSSFNSPVQVWDRGSGKLISSEPRTFLQEDISQNTVNIPALSPDGRRIASFSLNKTADIWDPLNGQVLSSLKGSTNEFHSASYSPDGKSILTAGFDSTAKIWDAAAASMLKNFHHHRGLVYAASFSPDGKKIVTTSGDSTAITWDVETGTKINILKGHQARVNSARFSPDGKKMVTASDDGKGILWDVETGTIHALLDGHAGFVHTAEFSPDGKKIATASDDGTVFFWDVESGMRMDSLLLDNYVNSAVFCPDGKKLVTTITHDDFSVVTVWSMPPGKKLVDLKSNNGDKYLKGEIHYAGFSPDGKWIVTASSDKTARVWNALTGKNIFTLKGHILDVVSVAFSPDSKKIVTTSWDNTLKIWNARNGKLLSTLISIGENDFLYQLPSGYYKSTTQAARQLYYVSVDLKIITFEQLDVKYNRPDKVLEELGSTDKALITSYRKAYEKRIKKLGIDTVAFRNDYSVPGADFTNRNEIDFEQKSGSLTLHIRGTDNIYNLDRYNVWVNETPVFGQRGINIRANHVRAIDITLTIPLSPGENRIETSITNVNGTESYRMPLRVNYVPENPVKEMTYFIGIGISRFADNNYNLQYSVKDIRDMVLKLKSKFGTAISIDTLFDEKVTVANISALKQKLQKTGVNDKVIIAYSGHGLLSKDFDYYLSTYAINFDKPEQNGLPYEELENLLDSIPSRKKLLLIDACHSGEVDKEDLVALHSTPDSLIKGLKPVAYKTAGTLGLKNSFELMQELFVNVGKSTGATIISAAAGTQFALERNDLENGVFTYAILEALKDHPTLTISELKRIVGERVEQLTNGLQKPTSRNEPIAVDWRIW